MDNQENKVNTGKRTRAGAHAHSTNAVKRRSPLRPILTFVIIVLGVLLALSVFFRVSKITVDGNSFYTEEQIIQASGIEDGDNMFFVNRFSAASRIFAKLPYVQKVTISRKLPNHVIIEIAESQELAYVVSGDTYWAMDSNGKVLEKVDSKKAKNLIRVDGLSLKRPKVGQQIETKNGDTDKIEYLATILNGIQSRQMMEDIGYIDMSSAANPVFDYKGHFTVKLGANENLEYKLGLLVSAVEKLKENEYGVIDLSIDHQAHFSPN